jgi:hypothetical protein
VPEPDVVAGHGDGAERHEGAFIIECAAEHAAVGQHDNTRMRHAAVEPTVNAFEQPAIASIVRRREPPVVDRMPVKFDYAEILAVGSLQQRIEPAHGPRDRVRCPRRAHRVGNRVNFPDKQPAFAARFAPTAKSDHRRFVAVAREKVLSDCRVMFPG